MKSYLIAACFVSVASTSLFAQTDESGFERIVLSREFCGEGACFADINGDEVTDVVSGAFWYEGPAFEKRHQYAPGGPDDGAYPIIGYSDFFFVFSDDFDGDGDADILSIPMPGTPAVWHENPGPTKRFWKKHTALDAVGGESPALLDINGDGQRELVCVNNGRWGFAEPHWNQTDKPWTFTPISEDRGLGRFTHGLGVSDIDGDGQRDLLERTGWWKQPAESKSPFTFHKFPFAQAGGSQMFAYDFDDDGDNDVVSVQNAHAWGLKWFERRGTKDDVSFVAHEILPDKPDLSSLNISQMHAVALADMDGDGIKDIITGKRYFAHNGNDPGAKQLPLLIWFKTIREGDGVRFEPNIIDKLAGVGTQLTVEDMNGDNRPDVVVGNKRGTVLFVNRGAKNGFTLTDANQQIGGNPFKLGVRETRPLSPKEELKTFVLPAGFKAELVASEPDIGKPMNMAFDDRGRLWVSSSIEYPWAAKDGEGRDTIKIFEDTTGDGRLDKITTFADKLNIPIGLYPYKDGVVCFSIPNIWFLRDTTGDGRADKREILYGPMGFERDTHGMCNAFTRGHDGWLYACHGFNNYTTVAGRDGHQIQMQSGNTFRMKLDGSRIEHFTHGQVNPFGMIVDEFGDQFTADCHTKPVTLLMQGGYYDSFGKPHDGLGYVPAVMNHLHGSTAIGGLAQVHDSNWPREFQGNTFGGNVMTSRINRNSLHRTGSTVKAREEPDFMMSGDPWFRPVDLQCGPDGALYVADFYNRIIGHYEVDLKHPGRDRTSGRIWRISYGDQNTTLPDLSGKSARQLVRLFKSSNLSLRKLAEDRLVDRVRMGNRAIVAALEGLKDKNPNVRIHSAWVLRRLGKAPASKLAGDPDERVRTHVARTIGSHSDSKSAAPYIRQHLLDASPMVTRAAAMAASVHRDKTLIRPLRLSLRLAKASDVHLRHALRMALRDHLKNKDWFQETVATVEQQDVPVLAGICLALRSEHAGEFLARNLHRLPATDTNQFTEYLKAAARYVPVDSADLVVNAASTRFADDTNLQLELLKSIDTGFAERGLPRPNSVTNWATELADELLKLNANDATEPLGWTFIPSGDATASASPWVVSTRRNSQDGQQNSQLYSSFPTGEQQTGTYRSAAFEMTPDFHFWMAGHDGFPDKPIQRKNYVRLRDAASHAIVKTWFPPRNDTAQRFELGDTESLGQRVYVELVDGDTANAFAWLAVGRFSNNRLNPSRSTENRSKGIELIGSMRLTASRSSLVQILQQTGSSRQTANEAVNALAKLDGRTELLALAEAAKTRGLKPATRQNCIDAVANSKLTDLQSLLTEAMKVANGTEQTALAQILTGSQSTAALLISMCEQGAASPRLLTQPTIIAKLHVATQSRFTKRIKSIVAGLPAEAKTLDALISSRTQAFLQKPGNATTGAKLFTKNCAVCHQVAGQGAKVGPNLDGVGTRGLARLMEDVLAPNRNVDINFRSTTVLTEDGQVISGLQKTSTGTLTVIVNSDGKEISIPTNSIEEKTTSRLSPMPANVTEKLSPDEFRDLMAYLLSLGA